MPNILRNMHIKRVAFVDEGANPDAHMRFAKSRNGAVGADSDSATQDGERIMKRVASLMSSMFTSIGKAWKSESVTPNDEMADVICAYMAAINDVISNGDIQDVTKAAEIRKRTKEFADIVNGAADDWSRGIANDIEIDADVGNEVAKARDAVKAYMAKGCGGKKPKKVMGKADENDDTDDDENDDSDMTDDSSDDEKDGGSGGVPPKKKKKDGKTDGVKKGVESDMNINEIDESRMSTEDAAAFDAIKKKYGVAGAQVQTQAQNVGKGASNDANEDVYKGIHPEVKAELERLRKYREDAETREMMEIAKKYAVLGEKPEELAKKLTAIKALDSSAYDTMISVMDKSIAEVGKSKMFSEIGKRGSTVEKGGDAWSKIEAYADEIMKSKPDMNRSVAVLKASEAHPELVAEYESARE